jgi:hypothetical protein
MASFSAELQKEFSSLDRTEIRKSILPRKSLLWLLDRFLLPNQRVGRVGGELLKSRGNRCLVQASTMLLPSVTTENC